MPRNKIIGYILIAAGILIILFVSYNNSQRANTPLVFSEKSMLQNIWSGYKSRYVEPTSGRTIDPDNKNITTSEGESYTMLRAVWMDDKETFDKSWSFARDNLQRPHDHLLSWLYGKRPDGTYGILTDRGGQNSASDADTDIALALIFAWHRWNDSSYKDAAKNIVTDIWNNDVFLVKGRPYMGADNFEHDTTAPAVINPSYFAPYAYRIFSTLDTKHSWMNLVTDSYQLLMLSASSTLDKNYSANLPPNWMLMDKQTGAISPPKTAGFTTDYGFDAFRTPWRLALDWEWFQVPEAKTALERFSFLEDTWKRDGQIHPAYSHDGAVMTEGEAPAMYGGSMGYFTVIDPKNAEEIYNNKLIFLFSPDTSSWKKPLSYYDDNWAWFGMALYTHSLPNYAQAAAGTVTGAVTTSTAPATH